MHWDDIRLTKMSNSKEKILEEQSRLIKLRKEDKLSNNKNTYYDTKYKNLILSKKNELETMSKKVTTTSSK
jgi:hypothetical protein